MSIVIESSWTECCVCGIPFGLTKEYARIKKGDRRNFYCLNGHGQHFTEESNEEKFRRIAREESTRAGELHLELLKVQKKLEKCKPAKRKAKRKE